MSTKTRSKKKLPEQTIDQIVIAQANPDLAWEMPVRVRRRKPVSIQQYFHSTKHASHAEEFNAEGR